MPTILQGIPLDIRSVQVKLDRPNFTLNPTNCDPMSFTGSAGLDPGPGGLAAVALPARRVRQPRLQTEPGAAPQRRHQADAATRRLTATLQSAPGRRQHRPGSGRRCRARRSSTTPTSATVCTRVQFAADAVPAGLDLRRRRGDQPAGRLRGLGPRLPAGQPRTRTARPGGGPEGPGQPADRGRPGRQNRHGQRRAAQHVRSGPRRSGLDLPPRTVRRRQGPDRTEPQPLREEVPRATVQLDAQNGLAADSTPVVEDRVASTSRKKRRNHRHQRRRHGHRAR